ncbi:MAG: hypothetical protein COU71_02460 [Parcubacteria group bacterium CG10_big_fil_rev_8_21_14_0_10_38_31]|nr:MAG: hypothetical protein COU71_02460 [Parcubacteria group bacterium CG10_big_fil_rev_8_21_14_0_10_38_31]
MYNKKSIKNEVKDITYFAEANFRNKHQRFGIKSDDRTKHVYVIGKTGMGKSTMLENMAVQDIQNGEGIAFIDPHGSTAELLLDYVPEDRIDDVIYFAPFDTEYPISFNVLEDVGYDKRHLVVAGLMSTFEKIWVDAWSARMSYILSNTLLALLEYPNSTLMSINRMLADKEYRKKVVDNITDPTVKSFWVDEFAKYTDRYAQEATPAIQNKIGQFTSNPLIRNIIGQPRTSFDMRKLMDEKKIIIINLSKGRLGEQNANLLGSMLITKIYLAAMSRADVSNEDLKKLPQFYFYVDEFQSFANKSFADILSEARKYKLNLTIAHQYIEQMSEEVNAAVFGNVGTMIVFRVGAYDADVLEKEFAPEFIAQDIVNLGFTQIYLRLMIDGVGSRPFSASTLPPISKLENSFKEKIIESSRRNYAIPRKKVEDLIKKWHEDGTSTVLNKPESIMAKVKKEDKTFMKKLSPAPTLSVVAEVKKKEVVTPEAPQMFSAECSVCGKKTYVPFEPDGKRAIYCKDHKNNSHQVKTDYKKPEEKIYVKPNLPLDALKDKSGMNTFKNNEKANYIKKDNSSKTSANLSALREALNEIVTSNEPEIKRKSGILKPGQNVKFD